MFKNLVFLTYNLDFTLAISKYLQNHGLTEVNKWLDCNLLCEHNKRTNNNEIKNVNFM